MANIKEKIKVFKYLKPFIIFFIVFAVILPIFVYIVVMHNGRTVFTTILAEETIKPEDIEYYNTMFEIQEKMDNILNFDGSSSKKSQVIASYLNSLENITKTKKTINSGAKAKVEKVTSTFSPSLEFLDTYTDLYEFADMFRDSLTLRQEEVLEKLLGPDEETQNMYLAMYVKAAYASLFPDTREADKVGTPMELERLQGIIQIRRTKQDGATSEISNTEALQYIPYELFQEKIENEDTSVLKNFSIYMEVPEDTDDDTQPPIQLVVATQGQAITTEVSNDPEVWQQWIEEGYSESNTDSNKRITANADGSKQIREIEYNLYERTISYQHLVAPYAMPFDLLWSFLAITKDPEFVADLANLVIGQNADGTMKTQIALTVCDSVTVTDTHDDYTYKKYLKEDRRLDMSGIARNSAVNYSYTKTENDVTEERETIDPIDYFKNVTVQITNYNTLIDVTHSDNWMMTYENEYNNEIRPAEETHNETIDIEDEEKEPQEWNRYYSQYSQEEMKQNPFTGEQDELISIMYDNWYTDFREKETEDFNKWKDDKNKANIRTWLQNYLRNPGADTAVERIITTNMTEIVRLIYQYKDDANSLKTEMERLLSSYQNDYVEQVVTICELCRHGYTRVTIGIESLSEAVNITKVYGKDLHKIIEQKMHSYETVTSNIYRKQVPIITEKVDPESEEDNFVTIYNSHKQAQINLNSVPDWFLKLVSEKEKTANMVDTMKWLLYCATGNEDYADVTINWEALIRGYGFSSIGGLNVFGCNITFEDFDNAIRQYAARRNSRDFDTYMVAYIQDFYDVCVANNINPILAFCHACCETGYGTTVACQQDHNYFGMGVFNGQSHGHVYDTPAESIQGFCNWINRAADPTTSLYNFCYTRSQEYAEVNEHFVGTPETNIYILYSTYAYLGDNHVIDDFELSHPEGLQWYLDRYHAIGAGWGSGGRLALYSMYEEGGIYTGEYATRCGHIHATDETTTAERADFSVYCTDTRVHIAESIFGSSYLVYPEDSAGALPNDTVSKIIALAKSKIGCRYTNDYPGRIGPNSFDCSGLIYWLYKVNCGINVPGYTAAYKNWNEDKIYENTNGLDDYELANNLLPGDVLIKLPPSENKHGHAALYIGNNRIIHAVGSGVKEQDLYRYSNRHNFTRIYRFWND